RPAPRAPPGRAVAAAGRGARPSASGCPCRARRRAGEAVPAGARNALRPGGRGRRRRRRRRRRPTAAGRRCPPAAASLADATRPGLPPSPWLPGTTGRRRVGILGRRPAAPASSTTVRAVTESDAHRVVVVGGGFGGLQAALGLRRAPVEVTLV